jgi:hypothetical protein
VRDLCHGQYLFTFSYLYIFSFSSRVLNDPALVASGQSSFYDFDGKFHSVSWMTHAEDREMKVLTCMKENGD